MLAYGRRVRRIMVHVVAVTNLARTPMTTPIVSNDAVALSEKIQKLGVPIVGAQRPSVMKHERLRVPRSPILVKDCHAILRRDETHTSLHSVALSKGCLTKLAYF